MVCLAMGLLSQLTQLLMVTWAPSTNCTMLIKEMGTKTLLGPDMRPATTVASLVTAAPMTAKALQTATSALNGEQLARQSAEMVM